MHYQRRRTTGDVGSVEPGWLRGSLEERARRFFTEGDPAECWLWSGRTVGGYGMVHPGIGAHRVVYELLVGPIPNGLVIDHICHSSDPWCRNGVSGCFHRRCVNPAHMEIVTNEENARRQRNRLATCPAGHDMLHESNVRWTDGGTKRRCRACLRAQRHERYLRLGK